MRIRIIDIITEIMGKEILTVQPQDDRTKLEKFLRKLGISHRIIAQLMRKGDIKVNSRRQKNTCLLNTGDIVEVFWIIELKEDKIVTVTARHEAMAEQLVQNILYKDENILILNKPAGIAVQGGNKVPISIDDLSKYLKFELENKPKLVHRLDRDTSGILVMARNDKAAQALAHMFKESGTIKKYYLALCNGVPYKLQGTISIPLKKIKLDKEFMCYSKDNGDEAITNYKVIKHNERLSLIQCQIITGRTHQVRAHCATSGIPIVGDYKYNYQYFEKIRTILNPEERKRFILNSKKIISYNYQKLCLHSKMIDFTLFDKKISVEAPLPHDLQLLVAENFS